jgi:membrane protein DedA with SNARE-associated domain
MDANAVIHLLASQSAWLPYLGIVAMLLLGSVGLPIPEEVTVVTGAILAHSHLNPWLAFVACLTGAVAGDCLIYYAGRRFGRSVVREHRLWAHYVPPRREARIEGLLARHGMKVLFVARFLAGVRCWVYLVAGILRLSLRRFLVIEALAAPTVVGVIFTLSYRFGPAIVGWIRNAQVLLTVVAVAAAIAAVVYLRRFRKRAKAAAAVYSSRSASCLVDSESR